MFGSSSILETRRLTSLKKNRLAPRKRTNRETVKNKARQVSLMPMDVVTGRA